MLNYSGLYGFMYAVCFCGLLCVPYALWLTAVNCMWGSIGLPFSMGGHGPLSYYALCGAGG